MNDYIFHHGIKGQKWGVRRYQDSNGKRTRLGLKRYHMMSDKDVYLGKGSKVYRIAPDGDEKYNDQKYFSIKRSDAVKWDRALGKKDRALGKKTYVTTYKTVDDTMIASSVKIGKELMKKYSNPKTKSQTGRDSNYAYNRRGGNFLKTDQEYAALNIAERTKTGKAIVKSLMKQGYKGVIDPHGLDVGKIPIVMFNTDKNLKIVKKREVR